MWTKPTPTAVARQLRAASQALMIGTEALLPAYCLVCDERCGVPRWLCPRCEQKITPNTSECPNAYSLNLAPVSQVTPPAQNHYAITARREPLNSAYAAFLHRGVMRELVHQWKFEQRPELTPFLVQLAFALGHPIPTVDYVIPIPMHWRQRVRRGYNQSALLASELVRGLNRHPAEPIKLINALAARRTPRPQHTLNRTERLAHSPHRFVARHRLDNCRVLLVDDVITTGATVFSAAESCWAAGATEVHAWCLTQS